MTRYRTLCTSRRCLNGPADYPALLDMTRIFYSRYVPEDPLIGPLFADMSPDHPERVAAWLSEVFGGPRFYSERYGGYQRMVAQHAGKQITPEQRARWATRMLQSADDAGLPSDAGIPCRLCRLYRMGVADRDGKFRKQRQASTQHAGAEMVVGMRCNAGCASVRDSDRRGD